MTRNIVFVEKVNLVLVRIGLRRKFLIEKRHSNNKCPKFDEALKFSTPLDAKKDNHFINI